MSNYLITWAWKDAKITDPTCLLVLLSIADQANDDGFCWPSIRSTARRCRISERQVQRWMRELEDVGILTVQVRPGTSNMYQIVRGDTHVTPRGDTHDTPGVTPMSGEGCHPRHPNHKEPSVNPPLNPEQPLRCLYCREKVTVGKKHYCTAMNQSF